MFFSTTTITQNQVVLDSGKQQILTQKIANILSTGEESTSYKKSMEKLNKKLIEEVGTDRTTGRPMNLVDAQIEEIKKEKENLSIDENRKENLENEINAIEKEIIIENEKIELVKEIKKQKEKNTKSVV